jgi:hypothetical protein
MALTKKVMIDGEERFEATDGSHHKTRSGARKRSIRTQETPPQPDSSEATVQEKPEDAHPPPPSEPEPSEPSWASMDWGDDDGGPSEYVPGVLKQIKPPAVSRGKPSKKELEVLKSTNIAVLKIGYKTADHVLSVYKRAALQDPEAPKITHSEADYEWISDITNEGLMENGIHLSAAIGPTQVMVLANGYWFLKPTYEIQKEAQKRGLSGKMGKSIRNLLEKLPIIGKRIRARKHQEIADQLLGVENNE